MAKLSARGRETMEEIESSGSVSKGTKYRLMSDGVVLWNYGYGWKTLKVDWQRIKARYGS